MRKLLSILFWSIIAAAFIGPGTVATAASAGAGYGYALLWALAFSTIACLVLQEASARLTVVSGRNLGQALRARYQSGWKGALVLVVVLGAIVLGCAAYEAGNILGGVAGAALGWELSRTTLTLLCGGVAVLLLGLGSPRQVAPSLSLLVAVMSVAFLVTSVRLAPPLSDLVHGLVVPSLPDGAGLLVIGLVGTTVVPYNLFLGSGLARDQTLGEVRLGLTVAVFLGGLISMGILVVGTAVQGNFSFDALAAVLDARLGPWARTLFAAGLLAAGLSSAVTAPLAAAVTARSLFASSEEDENWAPNSLRFRGVWLAVLAVGIGFGLANIRPVPAILLAQAFNGILLPLVAVFLLLAVNDRKLMGDALNSMFANVLLAPVVAATVLLGVVGIAKAVSSATGLPLPNEGLLTVLASILTLLLAVPVARLVAERRR